MNYTYREILLVALPVMTSILIEQLINITDAVFLGHVGEVELGAAAVAGVWFSALYMLGFGFSAGVQAMVAQRNGAGRHAETGKVFHQGLLFLAALAAALCVLSSVFSPVLLRRMIASEGVYAAAVGYLDVRVWGVAFSFPFLALRSFLVVIGRTRALTAAAVAAVAVNMAGNGLLVFGLGLGIRGAAAASCAAEACSLAVAAFYMLRSVDVGRYGLRCGFDGRTFRRVCRVSVWSMLQSFVGVAPWFAFFVAIGRLGETQLAAANIVRSVSTLFFVLVSSLGVTAGALAGNLVGAGDRGAVLPTCGRAIVGGYAAGMPLVFLALLFRRHVTGVYTDDAALLREVWPPYAAMLPNYLFALPAYVFAGAVTGTGATRAAFRFQLAAIACYAAYLRVLCRWEPPLAVYWSAEYLFVILLGVQSFAWLKRECGRRQRAACEGSEEGM